MLAGLLALEVTTSTPDALCPPLEEARAAIVARVGEVQRAYRVEFALIRSEDGQRALNLVLREGEQQLLSRELPLDDAGCQDAAQAMALVLERYFDALEKPPPRPALNVAPVPVSAHPNLSQNFPSVARDFREPSTSARAAPSWQARVGFLYDLELRFAPALGVTLLPAALQLTSSVQVGVSVELAPFLRPDTENVRAVEISASTLQAAAALPLAVRFEPWALWLGPWCQVRLQRANGKALVHGQSAYRAVPGLGGFAQLGWSPARSWSLGLGIAGGAQLTGATSTWVLTRPDGGQNEVLVPESWFGQSQLSVALEL
jgi:hypothetical protein